MTPAFPWYDASWLVSYVAARDFIRANHPAREAEFTSAFAPLRTDPRFQTVTLPSVFEPKVLAELRRIVAGLLQQPFPKKREFFRFGRHTLRNHPFMDQVQDELTARVSKLAGEELEPAYNFLSLYTTLGICEMHLDALDAKWTLDVCIDQSTRWPIQISEVCDWPEDLDASPGWEKRVRADPRVKFHEHTHAEGSGLLFSGSSQWHYRDRISRGGQQHFSHLAFFHFIPAGTRELVVPSRWAELFGIPGLAGVIEPSRAAIALPRWRA